MSRERMFELRLAVAALLCGVVSGLVAAAVEYLNAEVPLKPQAPITAPAQTRSSLDLVRALCGEVEAVVSLGKDGSIVYVECLDVKS